MSIQLRFSIPKANYLTSKVLNKIGFRVQDTVLHVGQLVHDPDNYALLLLGADDFGFCFFPILTVGYRDQEYPVPNVSVLDVSVSVDFPAWIEGNTLQIANESAKWVNLLTGSVQVLDFSPNPALGITLRCGRDKYRGIEWVRKPHQQGIYRSHESLPTGATSCESASFTTAKVFKGPEKIVIPDSDSLTRAVVYPIFVKINLTRPEQSDEVEPMLVPGQEPIGSVLTETHKLFADLVNGFAVSADGPIQPVIRFDQRR
jgi:hypothetical protein